MDERLPDPEYVPIHVPKEYMQSMEVFLQESKIPLGDVVLAKEEAIFTVREGIDYIKAKIYALETWGDLGDEEILEQIHELRFERQFYAPCYEYELC
jgi:hypothetical protein